MMTTPLQTYLSIYLWSHPLRSPSLARSFCARGSTRVGSFVSLPALKPPMAASSSAAQDDFDLYGDIDISSQLPSHVELEHSLDEAVARRTSLQAELQSLQQQFAAGKLRVEDLTRRMCVLLQTAQLEIKRKEDQLDVLRAPTQAKMAPQEINAATLAAAPPEEQKQLLGERLFPLVQDVEPHLAGKITGMLLEMGNGKLLALLAEPAALDAKVTEALSVLRQQQQQPQSQPPPPQPQQRQRQQQQRQQQQEQQQQEQRRAPPASRSPDQRHDQRRRADDRRRSRSRSPDRRRGRSRSRSPARPAAHTQGPRDTGRKGGERGSRNHGDRGRLR
jgi:hypothetical protein